MIKMTVGTSEGRRRHDTESLSGQELTTKRHAFILTSSELIRSRSLDTSHPMRVSRHRSTWDETDPCRQHRWNKRFFKRLCWISLAMVLVGPAFTKQGAAQTLSWDEMADGLDVGVWNPGQKCAEVPQVVIVKIDPERFRFATYQYLDEKLPAPLTIKEWQRRTGASVVLNAGLFRDDYSYMGLLLKDGRSVGTKRHPQWQGLFVAEPALAGLRKARVLDLAVDAFAEDHPVYREAAQSLMLLDRTGKPRVRQTGKRAHQTLIGEDRIGRILVMKTTDTAALWELAECLRDGLPFVHQVMAMDGGASSDLLIANALPGGDGNAHSGTTLQVFQSLVDGSGMRHIPLPSVIGVLPRGMERGKEIEGYRGK